MADNSSGFTPVDASAVHHAMVEVLAKAEERRSGSSAEEALRLQAAQLKLLRDKILDRLPPEFHSHRAAYPDYSSPDPASSPLRPA